MRGKNLYQKVRDAAVEFDETMPEIRQIWCGVRDGLWAYIRYTLIASALIIGGGMIGGLIYGALRPAHAATYDIVADVPAGSQRMCGRADPVLDLKIPVPTDGTSLYEWRERWRVATCDGHNPVISCPSGLTQWHHMRGPVTGGDSPASYRDYTCFDLSVPPQPDFLPKLRPCYDASGAPCGGIADQWGGDWYGTWYPGWPPPFCPPHLSLYDAGGNPPGRRVFGCR